VPGRLAQMLSSGNGDEAVESFNFNTTPYDIYKTSKERNLEEIAPPRS
jgi:hypothetical protein